jgi:transposase
MPNILRTTHFYQQYQQYDNSRFQRITGLKPYQFDFLLELFLEFVDQKWFNKALARERVKIENINREIKIFRICSLKRRHKQSKFNLFWNLVAGIVNLKLVY